MIERIVDGVQCPACNGESRVIDSRDGEDSRRRRRECGSCKHRYTTYEIHATAYDKLQTVKINTQDIDSVITKLHAIKSQLGETNGHRQD